MHDFPRFLYCQDERSGTDEYVLHTAFPRFLSRRTHEGAEIKYDIFWVDKMPDSGNSDSMLQLMADLDNWYESYKLYLSGTGGDMFVRQG